MRYKLLFNIVAAAAICFQASTIQAKAVSGNAISRVTRVCTLNLATATFAGCELNTNMSLNFPITFYTYGNAQAEQTCSDPDPTSPDANAIKPANTNGSQLNRNALMTTIPGVAALSLVVVEGYPKTP